jgi:GNAT superfamily N-acetyltransferase
LPAIVGFYTLSMAALERAALPVSTQKGVPAYPMPVALIGRFAIDHRAQRQGFGRVLLRDALERVLAVGEEIGCFGVVVDAKNEAAVAFYRSAGFEPTPSAARTGPRRMFLPMKTLRGAR